MNAPSICVCQGEELVVQRCSSLLSFSRSPSLSLPASVSLSLCLSSLCLSASLYFFLVMSGASPSSSYERILTRLHFTKKSWSVPSGSVVREPHLTVRCIWSIFPFEQKSLYPNNSIQNKTKQNSAAQILFFFFSNANDFILFFLYTGAS